MPGPKAPPVFKPGKRPPIGTSRPAMAAVPGMAVAPLEIPYSWLQPVLRHRTDKPYTTAVVAQNSGGTAYDADDAALAEYGDVPFSETLHTDCDADPANLVQWVLAYCATQPGDVPRSRFASLKICLSKRTSAERFQLMQGLSIGRHIAITDYPATWPAGLDQQIVEGLHHIVGQLREVELITSPLIGASHGVAGPWFRIGVSTWGGSDVIPF